MYRKIFFTLTIFLLFGCATPPEVKQLSIKQNEYFDDVINAVQLQSEALVIAATRLSEQAKERINSLEQESKKDTTDAVVAGIANQDTAQALLQSLSDVSKEASQNKALLDAKLESIRTKSAQITATLQKMKEVNVTLDAYIQSPKAGEAVVNEILKHKNVSSFLDNVTNLSQHMQEDLTDISTILNGIN